MLTDTSKWSHPRDNKVVPCSWQATAGHAQPSASPHERASTPAATAPETALPTRVATGGTQPLWPQRMVLLMSTDGHAAACEAANAPDLHLEIFTGGAEMLLACGAQPPACALIDARVQDVAVPAAVRAITERSATPVYVGVWDDAHSKQVGYAALDAGARGLMAMPATAADLRQALQTSGGRAVAGLTKIEVGSITVVEESRDVWVRGVRVHLAEVEFGLLWCLLRSFPRPVTHDALIHGCSACGAYRAPAIKTTASRLRHRLDAAAPGAGAAVSNIRGVGYVAREVW